MAKRKIGILTSGGDCPGLNATIRAVMLAGVREFGGDGVEFTGIYDGFHGLVHNECKMIESGDSEGLLRLLTQGGTFLGTKRTPHKKMEVVEEDGIDKVAAMKKTYSDLGLDCLLVLGGNGSHKTANLLSQKGLNVVGLPKTIDNDIWGSDVTFGFHTALEIGTEALDRIHTTACSHKRAIVVEIMGNKAGWLALYTGIAGGSDAILLPEIPYNCDKLLQFARKRADAGAPYSIIVVSEGALDDREVLLKKKELKKARMEAGVVNTTAKIVKMLEEEAGIETRSFVPGHMLRGGTPSAKDRLLSTQFGVRAFELIKSEKYGYTVAKKGDTIIENRLEDMAGKKRLVEADDEMVKVARSIGISFGDS
ncbi:MAG: ATP-dependent 6-phosphofructokinase [Oscillospiraceae bacterium]|nr:ATP-dependent 6-phosphofructokinase [Oscillospiraceae bacterium]